MNGPGLLNQRILIKLEGPGPGKSKDFGKNVKDPGVLNRRISVKFEGPGPSKSKAFGQN